SRLIQPVAYRGHQLPVGRVAGQLPEEGPTEALGLRVRHLAADRARGVVPPPLAAALGVGGTGDGAGRRAPGLEHLVVLAALLVGTGSRPGRGAAGRGLADAGP